MLNTARDSQPVKSIYGNRIVYPKNKSVVIHYLKMHRAGFILNMMKTVDLNPNANVS